MNTPCAQAICRFLSPHPPHNLHIIVLTLAWSIAISSYAWSDSKPLSTENGLLSAPSWHIELFSNNNATQHEQLWSQTKLVFGLGVGMMGVLAIAPEEISKWKSDDDAPYERWWGHVRNGPVWDQDNWAVNYIGHLYFGGVYYQVARNAGYNAWNSTVYSALLSTFYWEYGIEALAEEPSIQDLIYTPIAGWVYGEWAFRQEHKLRDGNGKVLGSKWLGNTSLFLLNPVEQIARGINQLAGRRVFITQQQGVEVKTISIYPRPILTANFTSMLTPVTMEQTPGNKITAISHPLEISVSVAF